MDSKPATNMPSVPFAPRDSHLPYLPGLDGLRAVAVIAVLLYHAEARIGGGFLGVETFFVLSGYLITALLLAEWRQEGRIRLGVFWARRARRLLPALFVMLIGTLTFAAIVLPQEAAGLFDDTLATLGYVMNWHLILGGQSYFDPLVRPSLLQHVWSLAVEEQFYLIWPLLFALGLRFLRARAMLVLTLGGALASALLMAALYQPDADPSRVYYGTDTRAAGLLLGSALAFVWAPGRTPLAASRKAGLALDLVGALSVAGLLAAYLWLDEFEPLLYQGGFALVALLSALAIAALTHPAARIGALLGAQPLRWIGLRSYGIYLWHWPVFMVTRPYLDVPFDGWQLMLLRLAAVLVLAELSYRFVETPLRRRTPREIWLVFATAGQRLLAGRHTLARMRRELREQRRQSPQIAGE